MITRSENITGQEVECLVTGAAYFFDNGDCEPLPHGFHIDEPPVYRETITVHWQTTRELKGIIKYLREAGSSFTVSYKYFTVTFESRGE
jgi:hypothetical protein